MERAVRSGMNLVLALGSLVLCESGCVHGAPQSTTRGSRDVGGETRMTSEVTRADDSATRAESRALPDVNVWMFMPNPRSKLAAASPVAQACLSKCVPAGFDAIKADFCIHGDGQLEFVAAAGPHQGKRHVPIRKTGDHGVRERLSAARAAHDPFVAGRRPSDLVQVSAALLCVPRVASVFENPRATAVGDVFSWMGFVTQVDGEWRLFRHRLTALSA